ncbi:MAG: KpsF/GutQ family sugar-phosphate isomerase [Pseudomonadota bacterium]
MLVDRKTEHTTRIAPALRAIQTERDGLLALEDALSGPLGSDVSQAIEAILGLSGRVIATGMGKSGHVAQKMAATLASTGTPAFFVHPGEAGHGDLGMITQEDAIIALSWSGETTELHPILGYAKRFGITLIAITSKPESTLAKASDIPLILPTATEACPHGLAPTTSTIMQLSLADGMAIALLEARGFTASDFGVFHPGGQLGAYLKQLADVMHTGDAVPVTSQSVVMAEAIDIISQKGFGCVGLTGEDGRLSGIITDGDVRRNAGQNFLELAASSVMTPEPITAQDDAFLGSVVHELNSRKITSMFVVDRDGRPVGLVHIHDLLRAGLA